MNKKFGPRGKHAHWENPLNFFVSYLGCWWNFHVCEVLLCIVGQIGTNVNWVISLKAFNYNYVKVFEKNMCLKIFVAIRFRQRDINAHWSQINSTNFFTLFTMFAWNVKLSNDGLLILFKNNMLIPLHICKLFFIFVFYFQIVSSNVLNSIVETHFYGSRH